MFELICDPDRVVIGKDIDITFKITDEFNRKNYKGKYIYLLIRRNGTVDYFKTNLQRYDSGELFWTVGENEYKKAGTYLVEARMSLTTVQSSNSKTIACNTFIINKTPGIKEVEQNNITAIENSREEIKCYKKNEQNTALIETVKNKVTLNIKKDRQPEQEQKPPVYTGVMISKQKYV